MIAIKGMDKIPMSCVECELKSGSYCYHKKPPYNLSESDFLREKPKDCPLVEIVTCKDCAVKQYDQSESEECGAKKYFCPKIAEYVDETPNFYCGSGERRE